MKFFILFNLIFIISCHNSNTPHISSDSEKQRVIDSNEQLKRKLRMGGFKTLSNYELSISHYRLIERNEFTKEQIEALNILAINSFRIVDTTGYNELQTFDAFLFKGELDQEFFVTNVLSLNQDYFKTPYEIVSFNEVLLILSGGDENERMEFNVIVNDFKRRCDFKSIN